MKNTCLALALLGAFAGSAVAADVNVYGNIDMGLNYTHLDTDEAGKDATDTLSMKSGQQGGSRWGLKGREDLGNGYAVSFILESGFTADDGALEQGRLFRRESSVSIHAPWGQVTMGRFGSINQGTGSWAKLGMLSAFSTSYGSTAAQVGTIFKGASMYDNSIAYQTPSFAGLKVYAHYAMGDSVDKNGDEVSGRENSSAKDRYYLLGATYNNGPFAALLAIDSINYKSFNADTNAAIANVEDSLAVTLGGSYDFKVAKVFLGAKWFDELSFDSVDSNLKSGKITGYAVTLSASAPVLGGKLMVGGGYTDGSDADSVGYDVDFTRLVGSVGFDYAFTKRTNVYALASWIKDSVEKKTATPVDRDPSATTVMVGLRHRF
ncbi:porin [Sutterella sp.]|uniref:porin n=1 Tax=Sutterella sp. TaxID=1981025 RepID=UPI0026E05E5B|nr:porin [Sutterella sp.]MDO5532818.1 porin [Sutterella sp.]